VRKGGINEERNYKESKERLRESEVKTGKKEGKKEIQELIRNK
jgi:hypothetical protein